LGALSVGSVLRTARAASAPGLVRPAAAPLLESLAVLERERATLVAVRPVCERFDVDFFLAAMVSSSMTHVGGECAETQVNRCETVMPIVCQRTSA
jgi:hypothetical protein